LTNKTSFTRNFYFRRRDSRLKLTTTDKLLLSAVLPTAASQQRLSQLLVQHHQEFDWVVLLRRADFHHLAPLLRLNVTESGSPLPVTINDELAEINRTWAARHLAYVNEAARLITTLQAENIEALPLKGAALMLGDYYPRAGLRTALDIDLLVAPHDLECADQIIAACGYTEIPGRSRVRPRQRLANESNHLWPRRGSSGLVLELHHRAFQYARRQKDLSFAELRQRATRQPTAANIDLLLPASHDLALHLVHHTIVDLQTTRAILRTFADLHFIFARDPHARTLMQQQALTFGFSGAAQLADDTLRLLAEGSSTTLDEAMNHQPMRLLLETALLEATSSLADAARLFEYFDFGRQPLRKLGNLGALLFTPRAHLEQIYGAPSQGSVYLNYLRRPFDLLRKFAAGSFAPATLWRVWKLRRLATRK
jgi:hypothetical protein